MVGDFYMKSLGEQYHFMPLMNPPYARSCSSLLFVSEQ